MIDMALAEQFSRQASEALGLLAFVGLLAAILRIRTSRRRDIMLAFVIFLLGASLREVPVYLGGMQQWTVDLVVASGAARFAQIIGCVLFIRAVLLDVCPAWGWMAVVSAVLIGAWLL